MIAFTLNKEMTHMFDAIEHREKIRHNMLIPF